MNLKEAQSLERHAGVVKEADLESGQLVLLFPVLHQSLPLPRVVRQGKVAVADGMGAHVLSVIWAKEAKRMESLAS